MFQSCDLEEKLCTSLNQIDQLSHTLSDLTAQLDMERNNNKVKMSARTPLKHVSVFGSFAAQYSSEAALCGNTRNICHKQTLSRYD